VIPQAFDSIDAIPANTVAACHPRLRQFVVARQEHRRKVIDAK
jgi:hypothetical protein